MPNAGGKLLLTAGIFNCADSLLFENREDPTYGTVTIEGMGYNQATTLKCVSGSVLDVFVSLKGSEHHIIKNLKINANFKAKYGIRMERVGGASAGNHRLEDVLVVAATQVGILVYGAENVYMENVYAQYGNPIGMIVSSFPPVADPTVVDSNAIDTSGTNQATGGCVMVNCKWGWTTTCTKAGLIQYRAHVRIFGGMSQVSPSAEANFIIDEGLNNNIYNGIWIDEGAPIGFRIGNYSSNPSFLTISDITARSMSGDDIIIADYMEGSTITNIVTSQSNGKITLGPTTQRNYISGFVSTPAGTYLTIQDSGIDNIISQRNYVNRGVAISITNGTWISHSLASTPAIVILTPRSNVNVWVMDRNADQFQIGVSTGDPVTVDWYAEV